MDKLFAIITEVFALTEFATPEIRRALLNVIKELESDLDAEGYEPSNEAEEAILPLRAALDDYMHIIQTASEDEADIDDSDEEEIYTLEDEDEDGSTE